MRDGWIRKPLGEIFESSGERVGTSKDDTDVLSVTKYDGVVLASQYFDKRVASKSLEKYKLLNAGDWAYSTIHIDEGSIARNNTGVHGAVSPMYTTMRMKDQSVLPRIMEHVLRSPGMLNTYHRNQQGSINRRRSLPWKVFAALSVALPPLHEQERIVDLMDSVDAAISAAQSEVDAAEGVLRKIRSAIPVATSSTPLGDLVKMRSGPSWKAADETAVPGPGLEPVLGITNTPASGQIDLSTRKYVRGLSATTQRLTDNSLVMIRTNGNRARIGNVYRSTPEVEGFAVSAFQIAIEPIDKSDSEFLYWVLGSDPVQDSITECASGSTGLGNIAIGWLKKIGIPQLDESTRTEYVENCSSANVLVTTSATALNCLRELRSSMLSALLSGEHEIPETYDQFLDLSEVVQAG